MQYFGQRLRFWWLVLPSQVCSLITERTTELTDGRWRVIVSLRSRKIFENDQHCVLWSNNNFVSCTPRTFEYKPLASSVCTEEHFKKETELHASIEKQDLIQNLIRTKKCHRPAHWLAHSIHCCCFVVVVLLLFLWLLLLLLLLLLLSCCCYFVWSLSLLFCLVFFLRFCRTWTKRYLIISQTRIKRVSRIHHRTILKRVWPMMLLHPRCLDRPLGPSLRSETEKDVQQ